MPSARVRTFTTNADGCDFVVGDVLDCFRILERALTELKFDPAGDRLVGVGDLAGRGPHSLEDITSDGTTATSGLRTPHLTSSSGDWNR